MPDAPQHSILPRITAVLLFLAVIAPLSSCRESPVLQQIVYTEGAEIDENNKFNNNSEQNTEENFDIASNAEDDQSNTQRDYAYSLPVKGDKGSSKRADDESYSSIGEERGSAGSRGTTETKTNHNSNNPGYEEKQTADATDDNIPRQVIDADSRIVPIPENVTTVVAVGDAALYVEALGGRGRLVASSESFTSSRLVRAVFGEEELANIVTLWTKDGSTQMEDDSFRQLVAMKPDACFVISGQTPFSDEQLRTLEDRLVPVVSLPPLNNSKNIFKTVELIGIVLGDRSDYGQRNAIEVAAQYMEWYGDIIRQARSYGRAFGGPDKLNLDHNRYEDFEDIIDDSLFASGTPYSL